MKCPKCKSKSKVVDVRSHEKSNCETTKRYRKCLSCFETFITYEILDDLFDDIHSGEEQPRISGL